LARKFVFRVELSTAEKGETNMGALTVTPELLAQLSQLKDKTELWDTDGNYIGLFTPCTQIEGVEHLEGEDLFDLAEAEQRLATEKPVHTTQEILQRLRAQELPR
jgi:hypothetical protein